MAENKKMSGASSHSHNNVNRISEPIDKWMTTLHQVRTLKSCTEDLDRKMLELQRLLGRMQAPLSVESPNFYGALGDLVWKSKDIAGEARIVAEDFRVNVISILKAENITHNLKLTELQQWEKSIETKIDKARSLPQQFTKLSSDMRSNTARIRTLYRDKKEKEKTVEDSGLQSLSDATSDKSKQSKFFGKMIPRNINFRRPSQNNPPTDPVHTYTGERSTAVESPVASFSSTHPSTSSPDVHKHIESAPSHREAAPPHSKQGHPTCMNALPAADTTSLHQSQDGRHTSIDDHTVVLADGKTNKGKGMTKDRVQGIFNKGIRLQNGMNEVDQAFKPVIQQMFALHEFYQQMRIGVFELRAVLNNEVDFRDRLDQLEIHLRESAAVLEDYQKSV